jgi:hypothetical protein
MARYLDPDLFPSTLNRGKAIACFLGAALLASSGDSALADKWNPPVARSVESPSGSWTASMVPGWGGKTPRVTIRPKNASSAAKGWDREPLNHVAPVDFFVSDHGALVTLGDWHREGADNAVVIYDERGGLVAVYTLEKFLTEVELKKVERTVSSRWWRYTSESSEFRADAFLLTTSWGQLLRFDTQTGKVSREGRPFEKFRSYCEGARKAREAVIYVSNVWKDGDSYTGRHCELRRGAALCHVGGERFRYDHVKTKAGLAADDFDQLIRGAGEMAGQIVNDGVYKFDKSFIHVQIVFGNAIEMNRFGAPEGGDLYWMRYRPVDLSTPSAKEWTKRLEGLLRLP